MTRFARQERAALADLMVSVGPDAPTLCEGWRTRDLAAHLVVRATRVDAAAGIILPAIAEHTKRVQDRVAALDWQTLLARVRQRPWWAVFGDDAANQVEYFVHHEDVRRAQPHWQPRDQPQEFAASLWSRVRLQARLALRRTPASVKVTAPGFGSVTAGKGGGPEVELTGPPQELLLFLLGRQAHAKVELTGPEHVTARMLRARYGI